MDFFLCVFVTFGVAFIVTLTLSNKSEKPVQDEESHRVEKKEDKKYLRAKKWEDALMRLGEETDFKQLLKEASYNDLPSESIAYEIVFTKGEYASMVKKIHPKVSLDTINDEYRRWFKFENLEAAIFAKHLSNHIDKLNNSIETLKSKKTLSGISTRAEDTLVKLEDERSDSLGKLKAVLRFKEGTTKPEFSDLVLIDEDSLISDIENNILSNTPTLRRLTSNEPTTTSPALLELNEFLLHNSVPQAISETLTNTMNQITHKLKQELETAKVEALTMEANALNRSAKQFHGIEE